MAGITTVECRGGYPDAQFSDPIQATVSVDASGKRSVGCIHATVDSRGTPICLVNGLGKILRGCIHLEPVKEQTLPSKNSVQN